MKDKVAIERLPNVCCGKPVVAGTRFPVDKFLIELADGFSIKEIAKEYNLSRRSLREVLFFLSEQMPKLIIIK